MTTTDRDDPAAGTPPVNRADAAATIAGLGLLAIAVGWLSWVAIFVHGVSGRCGGGVYVCDDGVIAAGVVIARVGVLVVGVGALIASIVRLAARRPAWCRPRRRRRPRGGGSGRRPSRGRLFGGSSALVAAVGVQQCERVHLVVWSPEERRARADQMRR